MKTSSIVCVPQLFSCTKPPESLFSARTQTRAAAPSTAWARSSLVLCWGNRTKSQWDEKGDSAQSELDKHSPACITHEEGAKEPCRQPYACPQLLPGLSAALLHKQELVNTKGQQRGEKGWESSLQCSHSPVPPCSPHKSRWTFLPCLLTPGSGRALASTSLLFHPALFSLPYFFLPVLLSIFSSFWSLLFFKKADSILKICSTNSIHQCIATKVPKKCSNLVKHL